ncbi:NADPH-dependent ferric siderophore reductase [Rubrivivax gelatinosus]|uniref:hypothetical protein n=1 Tax=Rubrivivax gelatinosus TaxID=28068 RepID=UPI0018C9BD15|nr:hypothetical protein [Rubrivivax gelatinosus]MBG6082174.1 NADPH-dependent ferric siderophore reductase [Rubrivivax gelatinosus]
MIRLDNPENRRRRSAPRNTAHFVLAAWLLALAGAAGAATVAPGAPLPALALQDQNERPWSVAPGTRRLVFAADRAGSELVQSALGADGAQRLAAARAVYVADIHAMPALVTRLFALPALRSRPYPVGLVRDDQAAAELPRRAGQATVLELDAQGAVAAVHYAADAAALQALLPPAD